MIPGHADLDLARLLASLGFPNNTSPFSWCNVDGVWRMCFGSWSSRGVWVTPSKEYQPGSFASAPVLISGDDEHPGVMEWLSAQGVEFNKGARMHQQYEWKAYARNPSLFPEIISRSTLSSLLIAVVERLAACRGIPAGG